MTEFLELKKCTADWLQLIWPHTKYEEVNVQNKGTSIVNCWADTDGSYIINVTSITADCFIAVRNIGKDAQGVVSGDKYLFIGGGVNEYLCFSDGSGLVYGADEGNGFIKTCTFNSSISAAIFLRPGLQPGLYKVYPQVHYLTKRFGAGNEPTIEEFKQIYPLKYYFYNNWLIEE